MFYTGLPVRTRLVGLFVLFSLVFDAKYLRWRVNHPATPRFADFHAF